MKQAFLSAGKTPANTKVLFANFAADGHFNPLTGLAFHLKQEGYDVRWYSSRTYENKIGKLGIPFFPFKKAKEIIDGDVDRAFPERTKIKGLIKKMNFDIINAFILRGPEFYADLLDIKQSFDFDVVVCDCAFTAIPFITDKMNIPAISIGVLPLVETSKDLPPTGIGMEPSYSYFGKLKQAVLRYVANNILFSKSNKVLHTTLDEYGIPHHKESVFDIAVKKATLLLQSGTPGFEYYRSDLGKNIRYIGAVLPYQSAKKKDQWFDERLNRYNKVVLVTQGTVEKDYEKLLAPVLQAYQSSDVLVVCTTGGSGTYELRKRYPSDNIIVEDFIPFADVMPYTDVYISNGGYGGVMLGIENELPMVVAGVFEGKNEINARIGYFKLGVNLKTEKPKPEQLKKAVDEVLNNPVYKQNVVILNKEFKRYDPNKLLTGYLNRLLNVQQSAAQEESYEKIY